VTLAAQAPPPGSPRDVERPRDAADPFSAAGRARAGGLSDWAKCHELVERVLPLLGGQAGVAFPCLIAGHESCEARGRFDGSSGTWRYRCTKGGWRSLAEARAAVVAGWDVGILGTGTQCLWFWRCALEAGLVENPLGVLLPALPPDVDQIAGAVRVAPLDVRRLYDGFGWALRVRASRDPTDREICSPLHSLARGPVSRSRPRGRAGGCSRGSARSARLRATTCRTGPGEPRCGRWGARASGGASCHVCRLWGGVRWSPPRRHDV